MRALLVQPRSPLTYWSYHFALPYAGKAAALPPLGLATLAALLPSRWEVRIVDLHLAPLDDADLAWADAVLVSGMLVHADGIRTVLRRARALGKRTVVGGPAATTSPGLFPEADHVFRGEAEGRLDALVAALEAPSASAPRLLSPAPGAPRPDLRTSPTPRFELLQLDRYASLAVQLSRGCPFQCEFCDIIEVFGRAPRLKSAEQILAELTALYRLGGRGSLFFVDDNFIGNRRAVKALLPLLAAWQEEHGHPFDLYTEASLDLAGEPELLAAMVRAGFSAVFVGIESPSEEALAEAGKRQNLRQDPAEAVRVLTRAGLEVMAGFIVGFDADREDIFDEQLAFIAASAIPRAMAGVLMALPGTALWRRLEREGRLRRAATGDQFGRPNFEPALDERALVAGYRRLLAALYTDEAFYARCERHLAEAAFPGAGALTPGWPAILARAALGIGVAARRRARFWRLVALGARRGRQAFGRAVTLAILGEHMIRYTEEVALPRLDAVLAAIDARREASAAPLAAASPADRASGCRAASSDARRELPC
ncbi:B12-binding domain-containing radical SAM protein [Anaeromyxobacter diazotrophicus]|uniref:B12-binding domain-containing radical SAM protein n=1 Tax=Anaeromyxobacter diazotrophicus TaxID=2590199 RepID=A0A7I9VT52_9BACT|nr:B12-binding domain-containing radical SAM protein [Anaeromyxobacter diazotrophicus]GEJ59481.1 B12-binding domain-containing radical SAM protein [Anaeromyxobacter diazotrophicus]